MSDVNIIAILFGLAIPGIAVFPLYIYYKEAFDTLQKSTIFTSLGFGFFGLLCLITRLVF